MKKRKFRYIFVFGLAAVLGALLLDTSQRVQRAEKELRGVTRAMAREEESLRVLKAEWAYLNSPERLEALASSYLNVQAPAAGGILADPDALPEAMRPALPGVKPALPDSVAAYPQKRGGQ